MIKCHKTYVHYISLYKATTSENLSGKNCETKIDLVCIINYMYIQLQTVLLRWLISKALIVHHSSRLQSLKQIVMSNINVSLYILQYYAFYSVAINKYI